MYPNGFNSCTCFPGVASFTVPLADAVPLLVTGSNQFGVRKSGAEGKCYKIICAKQAFHGRTFGGMSATPQEKIQKGFRPMVPSACAPTVPL